MEADLSRYHRVDFRDYYRGRLSLRRIGVLLRYLPREAATNYVRRDEYDVFSLSELLVMENGRIGPANPRHPVLMAEHERTNMTGQRIDAALSIVGGG